MSNLFGDTEIFKQPFTPEQNRAFKLQIKKDVIEYLQDTANYNAIDDSLIEVYASSLCDIRKYTAIIERDGEIVKSPRGKLEVSHFVPLKQKAFDNATKLADKLGILSINRKKLQGTTAITAGEDDFAEFD